MDKILASFRWRLREQHSRQVKRAHRMLLAEARIRPTHSHCPTEHRPRTLQHTPVRSAPPACLLPGLAPTRPACNQISAISRVSAPGWTWPATEPGQSDPSIRVLSQTHPHRATRLTTPQGTRCRTAPMQIGRSNSCSSDELKQRAVNHFPSSIRGRTHGAGQGTRPSAEQTPQPLLSRPRFAPIRPRTPPLPLTDSGDANQRTRSSSTHTQDPMPPPTPLPEQSNAPSRHVGPRVDRLSGTARETRHFRRRRVRVRPDDAIPISAWQRAIGRDRLGQRRPVPQPTGWETRQHADPAPTSLVS